MLAVGFSAMAEADLFEVDYNEVAASLTEVTELENFVVENEGVTYSELVAQGSMLVANISEHAQMSADANRRKSNTALGIPSFLWGCILGWVGILIVYLVTEDRDETKKALWGCIANGLVVVLFYAVLWGAWFSAASSASGI